MAVSTAQTSHTAAEFASCRITPVPETRSGCWARAICRREPPFARPTTGPRTRIRPQLHAFKAPDRLLHFSERNRFYSAVVSISPLT